MQLGGTTIRVACNQASTRDFVNAIGGAAPVIPRAGSVLIPCAVFLGDPSVSGNLLTDLSNLVTANCVIRAGGPTGAVLFQAVIVAADFHPGLTYDQWTAGTAAHFTFSMTPTDTNLTAQAIFIAIGVTTTNAGDISLVYCGTAQLKDYGIFNAAAPTVPPYTSWSKAESDARYSPAGSANDVAANLTSAAGGGGATDLSGVDDTNLPNYTVRRIREYVTNPGVGVTTWVLEPDADSAVGVRSLPALQHATNARSWRQRG